MADEGRSTEKLTRVFDFLRQTVFNMFTDSRKAAKWWDPEENVTLVFKSTQGPGVR